MTIVSEINSSVGKSAGRKSLKQTLDEKNIKTTLRSSMREQIKYFHVSVYEKCLLENENNIGQNPRTKFKSLVSYKNVIKKQDTLEHHN